MLQLNTEFIKGNSKQTPYYLGPLDNETKPLIGDLLELHKYGIFTYSSQPGERAVLPKGADHTNLNNWHPIAVGEAIPETAGIVHEQRAMVNFLMPWRSASHRAFLADIIRNPALCVGINAPSLSDRQLLKLVEHLTWNYRTSEDGNGTTYSSTPKGMYVLAEEKQIMTYDARSAQCRNVTRLHNLSGKAGAIAKEDDLQWPTSTDENSIEWELRTHVGTGAPFSLRPDFEEFPAIANDLYFDLVEVDVFLPGYGENGLTERLLSTLRKVGVGDNWMDAPPVYDLPRVERNE